MVGPIRPQFVLFGSSIVQLSYSNGGWGAILSDIYARKADIVLRGYHGWNTRRAIQVLDQVFPKDAVVQPALVIVYFGGNDSMGPHPSGLGPHVPLQEYVENMKKIVNHLKNLPDKTRIIFLTTPPVNEAKIKENKSPLLAEVVRTNELCGKYAEACVKLCQGMGVKVINLWTAIQQKENWLTTCFTVLKYKYGDRTASPRKKGGCCRKSKSNRLGDGVHLSAEGSKIVVEEILKVIKQADWKPCLHWKSMPTEFCEDSPHDIVAADGKTTLNPSDWTFHREIQWD